MAVLPRLLQGFRRGRTTPQGGYLGSAMEEVVEQQGGVYQNSQDDVGIEGISKGEVRLCSLYSRIGAIKKTSILGMEVFTQSVSLGYCTTRRWAARPSAVSTQIR